MSRGELSLTFTFTSNPYYIHEAQYGFGVQYGFRPRNSGDGFGANRRRIMVRITWSGCCEYGDHIIHIHINVLIADHRNMIRYLTEIRVVPDAPHRQSKHNGVNVYAGMT